MELLAVLMVSRPGDAMGVGDEEADVGVNVARCSKTNCSEICCNAGCWPFTAALVRLSQKNDSATFCKRDTR